MKTMTTKSLSLVADAELATVAGGHRPFPWAPAKVTAQSNSVGDIFVDGYQNSGYISVYVSQSNSAR